jgi:hypothetical protein
MSRKSIFIRLFGIMVFFILFITAVSYAEQYYDQYPGIGFVPWVYDIEHNMNWAEGSLYHEDTSDDYYLYPVNFNVPDGSTYFIKSIGIRYLDNLADAYLEVKLMRENLFTGASHIVASWQTTLEGANLSVQTASQGTISGRKLVDSKKFAYWLSVYFYRNGDVDPFHSMALWQVRIHYGT